MAATRLITMHQNKGKSVAKSLSDRTDYAKNCWSQARLAIFRPVELTNFRKYKNSQCTFSFRFTYYLMVIIHQLLLLHFHICFHDRCFL